MKKILKTLIAPTEVKGYQPEGVSWQKIVLMIVVLGVCLYLAGHYDYLNFRTQFPNL